jgi:hypothetical protein
MPLPIASSENLNIPPSHFNGDGLAVIVLAGGRYGGDWVIKATDGDEPFGELQTSVDERRKRELLTSPGYPDRAIETAFVWLMGETQRQGLRVVSFECLNKRYGPNEQPYLCLAQAIIASKAFTPKPGVVYADEMNLDAVMGYSS